MPDRPNHGPEKWKRDLPPREAAEHEREIGRRDAERADLERERSRSSGTIERGGDAPPAGHVQR